MKSKDVLRILGVSRVTLNKYVNNGTIKTTMLDNGFYDYDEDSVMHMIKKDERYNVSYVRISARKKTDDLEEKIASVKEYCKENNIIIEKFFDEKTLGYSCERTQFYKLVEEITHYKIKNVYVINKDQLAIFSYSVVENLFKQYQTNIIVINDDDDVQNNNNEKELFEELIDIVNVFSTKVCSERHKKKLDILKDDLELFIDE